MNLLINPEITIQEPKKNHNFGYYITIENNDRTTLKIKSKSYCGRNRGIVGTITKDGEINTDPKVQAMITPILKNKINFILDLAFGSKRESFECKMKNGLISLR